MWSWSGKKFLISDDLLGDNLHLKVQSWDNIIALEWRPILMTSV